MHVMTTVDKLPITAADIIGQVTAMGGEVTNNIEALAANMAGKLAERGVTRRNDGQKVDDRLLADASMATGALLILQMKTTSFDRDIEERAGEPDIAEERERSEDARQAAIGVQAAISTLLGDMDDPAIRTFQQTL